MLAGRIVTFEVVRGRGIRAQEHQPCIALFPEPAGTWASDVSSDRIVVWHVNPLSDKEGKPDS
jgi:hypothetical protein